MNYIPFGPTTNANIGRKNTLHNQDYADTLVARGFAKIAREDTMRFSALLKTIQREAMPDMTYPKLGAAWRPQTGPSFLERHDNPTYLLTWTDDTGQAWFQEIAKEETRYPIMAQGHKFTYPKQEETS